MHTDSLLIPLAAGATFALGTFIPASAVLTAMWLVWRTQTAPLALPWFLTTPLFLSLAVLAIAEIATRASADWRAALRELGPAPNLLVAGLTGAGLAEVLGESNALWAAIAAGTAYLIRRAAPFAARRNLRNLH